VSGPPFPACALCSRDAMNPAHMDSKGCICACHDERADDPNRRRRAPIADAAPSPWLSPAGVVAIDRLAAMDRACGTGHRAAFLAGVIHDARLEGAKAMKDKLYAMALSGETDVLHPELEPDAVIRGAVRP
jgi:hypothetical protein